MTTEENGVQHSTVEECLRAIPFPKTGDPSVSWIDAIVSQLRPYFILPKQDPAAFVEWMRENLGIREVSREDLFPALYDSLNRMRKGMSDSFWLLDRIEKNRMFFESCWGTAPDEDVLDEDFYVLIGYHPELDVFYSSSNFLNNALIYFRGIDPEDLLRESKELYPPVTALGYAAHLEGALAAYRGHLRRQLSNNS